MTPVSIIKLPHNKRCALYPGEVDEDGEPLTALPQTYLTLPIEMPASVLVTTGANLDQILAIDVLGPAGGRIQKDLAQVWKGICQYNRDCAAQGEGG